MKAGSISHSWYTSLHHAGALQRSNNVVLLGIYYFFLQIELVFNTDSKFATCKTGPDSYILWKVWRSWQVWRGIKSEVLQVESHI